MGFTKSCKLSILSKRKIAENQTNKKRHCFDIIFEWEDILAEELSIDIKTRSSIEFFFDSICRNIYCKTGLSFFGLFRLFDFKRGTRVVMFDASTKHFNGIYNNKRYIPCLIDYFLADSEYGDFVKAYKNNELVLVSNLDVFLYLKNKRCPIPLEHFPLSIPDCYLTNTIYKKYYDIVLAGRCNPLLEKWVSMAEQNISGLCVIRRKYENGNFIYYKSGSGEVIAEGNSREQYFDILSKSRMAIYSTPGMDGTREDANGWNQVTPRVLELMAAQCHVLARYPENMDTDYYGLKNVIKNIETYSEFEASVLQYMTKPIDLDMYNKYLENHVTSKRADLLKEILAQHGYI